MILLLGGTSETSKIAQALAAAGRKVLVSTATDVQLDIGSHGNIRRRQGRLDESAMRALICSEDICAVVDAGHPYAEALHSTARKAVSGTKARYFAFVRPGSSVAGDDVVCVSDHAAAAREALIPGKPILLTIGSNFAGIYAVEAGARGIPLFARVLENKESISACLAAGIRRENIITGRGPFTLDENREVLEKFKIGVIVTKNSGEAGGFPAKCEAARLESCRLIVVERSSGITDGCFSDIDQLVAAVLEYTDEDKT